MSLKWTGWVVVGIPGTLWAAPLSAQDTAGEVAYAEEVVYMELGGPRRVASLNYDRLSDEQWALRVGLEVDGTGPHVSDWFPQLPHRRKNVVVGWMGAPGEVKTMSGNGPYIRGPEGIIVTLAEQLS